MFNITFRSRKPATPFGTLVFFSVWLAFSGLATVMVLRQQLAKQTKSDWRPVEATIAGSEIVRDNKRFHVQFDLQLPGLPEPVRTKPDDHAISDDYTDLARQRDADYQPGMPLQVFANPADPADITLRRPAWTDLILPAVLVGLFVLIGVWGVHGSWRAWRRGVGNGPELPKWVLGPIVVLFFVGALTFGIWGTWKLSVSVVTKAIAARQWPATDCRIVDRWTETGSKGGSRVAILYEYSVAGRTYRSDQRRWMEMKDNMTDKLPAMARYAPGSSHVCYVNPADPYEAVIEQGLGWRGLFVLFPVVFLVIGVFGVRHILKQTRLGLPIAEPVKSRRRRDRRQPARRR